MESSLAFISTAFFVVVAWAISSPDPIGFGDDSRMGLHGVALVDFLGSNFLMSNLEVTSITFSFRFGSLGFSVSFMVPFSLVTL